MLLQAPGSGKTGCCLYFSIISVEAKVCWNTERFVRERGAVASSYVGFYRGSIGIMEKKMETTI